MTFNTFSPVFVLAGLECQRSPAYTCMTAKGFVPYCDESAEPPLREYITYARSKVSGCLQADDMKPFHAMCVKISPSSDFGFVSSVDASVLHNQSNLAVLLHQGTCTGGLRKVTV